MKEVILADLDRAGGVAGRFVQETFGLLRYGAKCHFSEPTEHAKTERMDDFIYKKCNARVAKHIRTSQIIARIRSNQSR